MDLLTDKDLQHLNTGFGPINREADEETYNFAALCKTLYTMSLDELSRVITRARSLKYQDLVDTLNAYIDRHRSQS